LAVPQTKNTNDEDKHSEVAGTGADDCPGRFPDLFSNRPTQSRRHSQRQFCRTGDVSRDDRRKLTQQVRPLERKNKYE
jgi:hypothetical protein